MIDLLQFVRDHAGFEWRRLGSRDGRDWIELQSQTWRGEAWRHDLVSTGTHGETCLLYVTGGVPNDADLHEAQAFADRSGIPVAMLFGIPNQPLFDGRMEDDLIAYTFERFLESGDGDWPLLFPMTRAVIRAMDALEQGYGFKKFIVAGASKRGWTTWLSAGTGDPRIVGIAPMVIDNLNFPAQMAHQLESWGRYSEEIEDYTIRDLPDRADSDLGRELVRRVDPFAYLDRIGMPILVVNGANDPYWTVDALSLYWDELPPSRRCLIVPNVGHLLGDKSQMIATVSEFVHLTTRGKSLPSVEWGTTAGQIQPVVPPSATVRVWCAESPTLDFRDSEWREATELGSILQEFAAKDMNVAALLEARFEGETGLFSLSAPVRIFSRKGPGRSPSP